MITKKIIKNYIKSKGLRSSDDYFDLLEEQLLIVLDRSIERAHEDKVKTIMTRHL